MSMVLAYVVARIVLLAVTVVFNLPLLLLMFVLRRRVPRQICGALVAAGFAIAVAYILWRIEWFDVWRHGVPSVGYLLGVYLPFMSTFGVIGYAIGYAIARKGRVSTVTAVVVLASVLASAGTVTAQSGSSGQAPGCNRADDVVWPALASDEPIFSEAMEFARALMSHGFVVECVAPSTMVNTFEGQAGAALYRTNRGSFEVLFLPRSENFDLLQIIERQADGRYLYSFAGRPKPWPANLVDSSRPVFYIKSRNRLIVAFDDQVAARLHSVIQGR